jgi:lipopolysaccharide transport system ATP-binding protein
MDRWGKLPTEVSSGDPLILLFEVDLPPTVPDANLAVHLLRTDDGVLCLDTSTKLSSLGGLGRRRSIRLEFGRLDLGAGAYEFEVGLYSVGWEYPYDYHWHAYPLRVTGDSVGAAVLSPPLVWAADPRQSSAAEI